MLNPTINYTHCEMSRLQFGGITRKLSDNRLLIRNLLHKFKSSRSETFNFCAIQGWQF